MWNFIFVRVFISFSVKTFWNQLTKGQSLPKWSTILCPLSADNVATPTTMGLAQIKTWETKTLAYFGSWSTIKHFLQHWWQLMKGKSLPGNLTHKHRTSLKTWQKKMQAYFVPFTMIKEEVLQQWNQFTKGQSQPEWSTICAHPMPSVWPKLQIRD